MQIDTIDYLDSGVIQIRFVKENGEYHRECIEPTNYDRASELGLDTSGWTQEVINNWNNIKNSI